MKSGGTFLLAPGLGLIWRTETPFAVVTVMSPGGFLQEAQGQETMRMPAARLPFMARLYGMMSGALTGDWAALSDIFSVTREDGGPGQPWRLRLEPLKPGDPNMPVRSITVSGTRFVETLEVMKPEGDRDRITLLDQRLSTTAPTAEEARLLARPGAP
nr:LolA-related protein [Azospirillum sp. SYSU D00513]